MLYRANTRRWYTYLPDRSRNSQTSPISDIFFVASPFQQATRYMQCSSLSVVPPSSFLSLFSGVDIEKRKKKKALLENENASFDTGLPPLLLTADSFLALLNILALLTVGTCIPVPGLQDTPNVGVGVWWEIYGVRDTTDLTTRVCYRHQQAYATLRAHASDCVSPTASHSLNIVFWPHHNSQVS